jgi:citrate synthase
MMSVATPGGMEEVIAADTAISWIDGVAGELRYRGYPVGELADSSTYEAVASLLWNGELPGGAALRELRGELRALRHRRTDVPDLVTSVPIMGHPLDVVRFIVSWDALNNPLTWDNSTEANRTKAVEMTAWFPVAVAAYHRRRRGLDPVPPRPDLDTAANFLYMLDGQEAAPDVIRTLDISLILHADHELNASTFAARVTIATQSNLHAAIVSALGTLTGPRHGGASERVITMLEEIGTPGNAEPWAMDRLARRERIMGFGHRAYRTVDPRSRHLRAMAERILQGTEHEAWIGILQELSRVMAREKSLYPNVDLYAAVVNRELGIDPDFYTSVFAISRIAGWTAHAMEQLGGRMIRPAARYTGPGLRHVPS